MIAKTHRSFAMASATTTMVLLASTTPIFTDVDPQVQVVSVAIVLVATYLSATLPDFDQYIPFISHRGITHAIWIPLALMYATWFHRMEPHIFEALLGVTIGYTSHIIGDAFSAAGIAFLYPFQRYTRLGSGAFYVKGPRGPFQPLYSVGAKTFINPSIIWYGIAIAMFALFVQIIM